ncbi:MAG: dihydroorotate dehydrogenase family protein [Clostridiales bacterium]|nr:dihydroorotate dehydrogenase family protein [Clostridiales bacterium]
MFKKENCKGADISSSICGIKMQSPYILTSGPLSYAAEGLIRAHQAGCGAVVTKTIRLGSGAINPVNHMSVLGKDSLINCEKWADTDRLLWYEREIPMTKNAGAVVIGSVGHSLKEAQAIVQDVEKAGADIIELVSYAEETLLPMLDFTKNHVNIPVICKLSGNWPNAVSSATKCLEHGADGIAAIDSVGPTLKINIKEARPEVMSADGYGWMSGAAIKPISLRINSEIARNHPELKHLYGSGGCMSAEDAIEFLMAGCNNVGVCTVGILNDIDYIETMCYDLSRTLKRLGYNSLQDVIGVALPNFPKKERISKLIFDYKPNYAPCQDICPAGVNVPQYIESVRKGQYLDAYNIVSNTNPFPAVCGRVCDHPCEAQCRRGEMDEPIQIRLLKRTAADKTYEACGDNLPLPQMEPQNGKKVAVVGAGPAGLSAAYYLSKKGYKVEVLESNPVAGGMLAVGIPEYRLPKDILQKEIKRVERMGVNIRTGVNVGKDVTLGDLRSQGFDSILIAVGAQGGSSLNIPGSDLAVSGIQFLKDVNLHTSGSLHGKKVVIVGGGNVAMDAARSALRIGSNDVTVAYRRTKAEMPAYPEEIVEAEKEGIKFLFLASPNKIEAGKFYYEPMKLGEKDASGRRKPVPSGEPVAQVDADMVISATEQKVEADFMPQINSCTNYKYKTVENDVFVAGDCLTGPASVIGAIAAGRDAASEIDKNLSGNGKVVDSEKERSLRLSIIQNESTPRKSSEFIDLKDRVPGFKEVELGLNEADCREEAGRCLKCGCINCGKCVAVCAYDARKLEFPIMTVDQDACRSCGCCVSVCPTGALTSIVAEQTMEDMAREKASADFFAEFASAGH